MTVHLAQIDREIRRAEEGIPQNDREIRRAEEGIPQNEFHLGDAAEIAERLRETYEGKVNLVYLDPPFLTGKTFEARVRVGAREWKSGRGSLVLSAYHDNQTREAYLEKMRAVLVGARALMASDALIFVHIDWRMHPYLRLLMDEIFGVHIAQGLSGQGAVVLQVGAEELLLGVLLRGGNQRGAFKIAF